MDKRVLHELWIMSILTLGGPLDAAGPTTKAKDAGKGKGKEVEKTEESKLAIVKVLLALMTPMDRAELPVNDDDEDDPLGESIDWTMDDAIPPLKPAPSPPSPPPAPQLSILFHTLTTFIDLSATPSSLLSLQLTSLAALSTLVQSFLIPFPHSTPGPSPLLATALPGTASALSRIALSLPSSSAAPDHARRQPSAAITASLDLLSLLIVAAISDDITADLRAPTTASLSELVSSFSPSTSPPTPTPVASAPTGPILPTTAWLTLTLSALSTLLSSLSPLTTHPSSPVRTSFVHLLSSLLSFSPLTLGPLRIPILSSLLALSTDSWPAVAEPAKDALGRLLPSGEYEALLGEIVRTRLAGLPRAVLKGDASAVVAGTRIVRAALGCAGVGSEGMEKWGWSLVRALSFERVGGGGEGGMERGWREERSGQEGEWPEMRVRGVERESRRELEELWRAVGVSAGRGGIEGEVVEMLLGVVGRGGAEGESALWILEGVLKGFEGEMGKGRKKVVRGVVKAVLVLLEELEEEKEETAAEASPTMKNDSLMDVSSDLPALSIVEHTRGLSLTPSLDALHPVASPASSQASHRLILASLALRTLSTAATLLGSSFQLHLLQSLYHVLAHLSPTAHPLLQSHAQCALTEIAYATDYASPQNLVLANVDYVVNSVSQRLSISRLDPAAPLVLVEMIRLVGEPIVPMVQDLVEDVLEALDDYHGYEEVTVGLWAVLDALMRVMASGVPRREEGGKEEVRKRGEEWGEFVEWFEKRGKEKEDDQEEEEVPNPRKPFESGFEDKEGPTEFPQTEVAPPTRPQTVAAEILSKSLYFLSHSSPFLRSRVLSLITSAVPLLMTPADASSPNRQGDLLPVIHRAWPYILNRLCDSEPYVVLEAAFLVEALATHVGSFMSRRILDDVWPRFRTLLDKQEQLDRQSAIAGKTTYTASHRLHRAILGTMGCVARDVPLKEDVVWEMGMLFRRFLDQKLDEELQSAAREVYGALGRINADAVWLVLAGSVDEDLPTPLRIPGVDIKDNVERLLQPLDR